MAKTMTLTELLAIAAGAGVKLERADESQENLYVYADPKDQVLYIGRSKNRTRGRNEERIKDEGYANRIGVGFSALIAENRGVRHRFRYEPETFDDQPLRRQIKSEDWKGVPVEELLEYIDVEPRGFTIADVEHMLVRIAVCTGRLIGNSQYASQWEKTVNRPPNVAAVIAADIARQNGVLPANSTIASEGDMVKAQ